MSPWLHIDIFEPRLPDHCQPTNEFLHFFSSTFHTCIPTPLAFISTVLGVFSIISWLFAQLPQIYKNYTLSSTSGLSIFFLAEWCLGDLSNLLGAIFTRQAVWQMVVAGYYCSVDVVLIVQWIWYEHWKPKRSRKAVGNWKQPGNGSRGSGACAEAAPTPRSESENTVVQDIQHSNPRNIFGYPWISSSPSSSKEVYSSLGTTPTPSTHTIHRHLHSSSPLPSPKALLYVSLVLALAARASPLSSPSALILPTKVPSSNSPVPPPSTSSPTETAGRVLAWLSTLLYLGSRLPQLYKNAVRRSTSGLSLSLFVAAFFGNLFYSSSLLTNPCAWASYPPNGGRGWVGPEGSDRVEWVSSAAPFWLGAAGVLIMDAMVGVQFWWFGTEKAVRVGNTTIAVERSGSTGDVVLIVPEIPTATTAIPIPTRPHWQRRVSGWMRGWIPSVGEVVGSWSRPPSAIGKQRDEAGSPRSPLTGSETEGLLGKRKRGTHQTYGGI